MVLCVCLSVYLSYHSILILLGSNGLHDATQKLAWGCQHGGSSVHNGLAALRAPAGLLAVDLESVGSTRVKSYFLLHS